MTSLELFERLGLALAIGLLVGVERGWQERDARPGSRAAGIRTFALIGLLGGVSAALAQFGSALFLGFSIVAFGAAFALFEWSEAKASNASSATGMIAGLVTFALAALAVYGAMAQAAAGAVAVALLLAERSALHTFVERLRWSELRAALVLLAMTVILLPLLPDRNVDPWNALNPRELWAMTAAIAGLSYAGYACVRLLGERRGLLFGAAAAGLVSSTAVTINYSVLPRTNRSTSAVISAGIVLAWAVSLARMAALAIFIAPPLVPALLPPVGVAVVLLLGAASWWYLRSPEEVANSEQALSEPFDLGLVLRFGALLAIVVLVYKLASTRFGSMGLFPLAALSGVADVDPITLAVARSAGAAVSIGNAAKLVLLAGTTNFVTRVAVLLSTRDMRFALPLVFTGATALGLAWLTILLLGI